MFLADKWTQWRDKVLGAADRLLVNVAPEKRRLVLTAAVAVIVALLALFVITKLVPPRQTVAQDVPAVKTEEPRLGIIPNDDLFLPDEPDFVPGVMPGREPRTNWTVDDAAPWWLDPLKDGEEQWRDRIEHTIDAVMEKVP